MSKSKEQRLCQKHHHEGDEHRCGGGYYGLKDGLSRRGNTRAVEERDGDDAQKRGGARHDGREDNDAQVACTDDVFARDGQRCPIALPSVLIVVAGQRVHDHDGRHGADRAGAGTHARVTVRCVGEGQYDEDEQADARDARDKRADDGELRHKGAFHFEAPFSVRRR